MRRPAALALALLLSIPALVPVSAAERGTPTPDASRPAASTEPTTTPTLPTEPPVGPSAAPAASTSGRTPAGPATRGNDVRPDPAGRYIVMLRGDANTATVISRHRQRDGLRPDRRYKAAFRGFAGPLDAAQRRALLADPSVLAVVPDEEIHLTAQTNPTGISRVGARSSSVARIDNVDDRVDADIAIVDTGVGPHPDLNIAGGHNCSSSDPNAWQDQHGHGTHVAGTAAAIDNDSGVVGVAPGARIWAVRILNSSGAGLLSWYVCGLDWILSQRDPSDSSRPLFEAVNMSVAKSGSDDVNCGISNHDVLHQAICRLYRAGITVVAAAANEHASAANYVPAAYNEVITVSALADTDGRPGGLGGDRCYSWGGYDVDDTFADFSNYGSDVDVIAPGKCIWSTELGPTYGYMSGTSMATPHVTGAVALYKASRPLATPAEVRESLRYLGNLNWRTSTDPDSTHEPMLDVSRIAQLGSFSIDTSGGDVDLSSHGGSASVPIAVTRTSAFFERVRFSADQVPTGWTVTFPVASLFGFSATTASASVTAPATTKPGTYHFRILGTNWGRTKTTTVNVVVSSDRPTAKAATISVATGISLGVLPTASNTVTLRATWPAATDPSDTIVGSQVEHSVNGGAFGETVSTTAETRTAAFRSLAFSASHRFRVRAQDSDGDWSPWVETPASVWPSAVGDRSSGVTYRGTWKQMTSSPATSGSITTTTRAGASVTYRFTGTGIGLVAPTSATRGKVKVYIDGVYRATVDLRTSTTQHRRVVYARSFATSGTHTIQVVALGTTGRPMVSIDAFVVLR